MSWRVGVTRNELPGGDWNLFSADWTWIFLFLYFNQFTKSLSIYIIIKNRTFSLKQVWRKNIKILMATISNNDILIIRNKKKNSKEKIEIFVCTYICTYMNIVYYCRYREKSNLEKSWKYLPLHFLTCKESRTM